MAPAPRPLKGRARGLHQIHWRWTPRQHLTRGHGSVWSNHTDCKPLVQQQNLLTESDPPGQHQPHRSRWGVPVPVTVDEEDADLWADNSHPPPPRALSELCPRRQPLPSPTADRLAAGKQQ